MINFRAVFMILGLFLMILAGAMAIIMLFDNIRNTQFSYVFMLSALITGFTGLMLYITCRHIVTSLSSRSLFLMMAVSWLVLPGFATLPFLLSGHIDNFTDAYFETVSGLTTTGATLLVGLDHMDKGLLLWRSLLQWIGGVGVVVMAIAALPMLRLGGMQIFRMEFAEQMDKAMPRVTQIALSIFFVYACLSFLCAFFYYLAGMSFFDALNHAMTTVSTAGFSTHDASTGYFDNMAIDWIAIMFMLLGALPFLNYIQLIKGNPKSFLFDTQMHWMIGIALAATLLISYWIYASDQLPILSALHEAIFAVVTILTTTGYVREDYSSWGAFVLPLFFVLMFIGGCNGGTSGGLKIFRLQLLAFSARAQIHRLLQPHAVQVLYYNHRPVPDGLAESVMGFFFFYVMMFGIVAIGLGATGVDFLTATSGAASAIANVGPALGKWIGPHGNFSHMSDAAKWILSMAMLLGRLELFTLLVIIFPKFWRD